MDSIAQMLEIVAVVLLLGAVGEFVFSRTGIPDVLWLVCAGVLAGPVFGFVSPTLLQPAVPLFGAVALTIILSGGASRLRLEDVATAGPRGLFLGLAGFVFSVASVCLWLWLVTAMGFVTPAPFLAWLIVGTIVGGTSSLIIMPTTGGGKVNPRIARLLEVESSSTDALSIVLTMVLLDLLVTGGVSVSRPLLALVRELGIGVGVGVVGASVLLPVVPALRNNPHAYTAFLAAMLLVYGVTSQLNGNGAMAVLTAALLVGNASSLVPRFIPGADAQTFVADPSTRAIQDQMSFLIKSFFFVLIGLMFPDLAPTDSARRRPRAAPAGGTHPRRPARDPRSRSVEKTGRASDCRRPAGIGGGRPLGDPRALRHRRSRFPAGDLLPYRDEHPGVLSGGGPGRADARRGRHERLSGREEPRAGWS